MAKLTRPKFPRPFVVLLLLVSIAVPVVVVPSVEAHCSIHHCPLPKASVSISPVSQPRVGVGGTVSYTVSVAGMPVFQGLDVAVKTDNTILNPTGISTAGSILPTPTTELLCLNNVAKSGPSCQDIDGAGVAHIVVICLGCSSSGSGPLFTITYTDTGAAGAGSLVTIIRGDVLNPFPVNSCVNNGVYGSLSTFSVSSCGPDYVVRGTEKEAGIRVTSFNGFAGTVQLIPTAPAGLTAAFVTTAGSFTNRNVTVSAGGTEHVFLTIGAASTSLTGRTIVVVTGTFPPGGTNTHTGSLTVFVTDFTVNASPTAVSIVPGGSATVGLTVVSVSGFAGTLSLSAANGVATGGPSLALGTTSVVLSGGAAAATLSISTASSTAHAIYNITVTASVAVTNTGSITKTVIVTHTALVLVNVGPIGISVTPTTATLSLTEQGPFALTPVTVSSLNGFTGNVTLTTSATPPSGITATVSPTSVLLATPSSSAMVTLNVTSTAAGDYSVVVTGGRLSVHQDSPAVTVHVAGFTEVADTSSLTIARGASAMFNIFLTSINGFSGSASLSASCTSPTPCTNGPTVSPTSATVTLPASGSVSQAYTVSAAAGATTGSYSITVMASITSGSVTVTHATLISVVVT